MRGLIAVILVATGLTGCIGGTGPLEPLPPGGEPVDLAFYGVDGDPMLGDANASVQVIAYDAPGCANCKRYHDKNFPTIQEEFIDTGAIGYHFVQWSVYRTYDLNANMGLECVYRTGGVAPYVDMVDRLYADLLRADARQLTGDVAEDHGHDRAIVEACYDGEETRAEVEADYAAGKDSGAGNNPGFVVIGPNGIRTVHGTQGPYDVIAEALAA